MMNPLIIKKIIVICLIWSSFSNSQAQNTFQKTYGGQGSEAGETFTTTADGGYMVVGHTTSFGAGGMDAFVSKLDGCGNLIWSKAYGGRQDENGVGGIAKLLNGKLLVYGTTASFGAGNRDAFLLKTDVTGTVEWAKTYGGPNEDYAALLNELPNGEFILTITSESFTAGNRDLLLIKVDNMGTVLWSNSYGFSSNDNPRKVFPTSDGGYLVEALSFGSGAGQHDGLLLKIDANGQLQWSKTYGSTNTDNVRDAVMNQNEELVMAGFSNSFGIGNTDAYICKVNNMGEILWSKAYNSSGADSITNIQKTANGYVLAGTTSANITNGNDVFLMEIDENGAILWSSAYGGASVESATILGTGLEILADGSIAVLGRSESYGIGGSDVFLFKTDAVGGVGDCSSEALNWTEVVNNTITNEVNPTVLTHTIVAQDADFATEEIVFQETTICQSIGTELTTFTATRACNSPSIQLTVDNPNSNNTYNYWVDLNNNGIQDANIDLFAAGATVDIYPPSGSNSYTIYLNYSSGCDLATAQLSIPNDLITFEELDVTTAYVGSDNVGIPALNCEEYEILVGEGTAPYNYSWDTDGYVRHAIIETGLIKVCAGASATWAVTITDVNGCSFVVDSGNLGDDTLDELAITSHSIMLANCRLKTGQINIEVTGGQAPYQYTWEGPTTWLNQNSNTPLLENIPTGWYTVTVTDSNTPPESVTQEYWVPCRTDRFKEMKTSYLTISPNPVHKEINLQFMTEQSGVGVLSLYDITGKKVKTLLKQNFQANTNYTLTQSLGNLVGGVYYIQFSVNYQVVVQQKLLKVK